VAFPLPLDGLTVSQGALLEALQAADGLIEKLNVALPALEVTVTPEAGRRVTEPYTAEAAIDRMLKQSERLRNFFKKTSEG
jgi:hypothetical protein